MRCDHTQDEFRGMFTNTDFTGPFAPTCRACPRRVARGTTPDVVGYGDIHGAYLEVDDGSPLFNAGSVGNPLDGPDAPYVILEGVGRLPRTTAGLLGSPSSGCPTTSRPRSLSPTTSACRTSTPTPSSCASSATAARSAHLLTRPLPPTRTERRVRRRTQR